MACIKGNAYGHELVSVVARAQERVTVDVLVELTRETAYAHVS